MLRNDHQGCEHELDSCAANIGSAATLIGNPQNMLSGTVLKLDFGAYFMIAFIPVAFGLVALWALIVIRSRGRWQLEEELPVATTSDRETLDIELDRWQTAKGQKL